MAGGCRSPASTRGRTWPGCAHPDELADPSADLRILLCHFPGVIDKLSPGSFRPRARGAPARGPDLRALPRAVAPRAPALALHRGAVRAAGRTLHLSPGLGTTFVPFRFLARPEATELILGVARADSPRCSDSRRSRADHAPKAAVPQGLRRLEQVATERGLTPVFPMRPYNRRGMTRVTGLTGATLPTAPTVCHECIFWQAPRARSVDKRRWIEKTEDEWGAWGTVYCDADGRLLGSMQYGPARSVPARVRAARRAALRRRGARHVRVPDGRIEPVGDAVALPDRDRRCQGEGGGRARGLLVPLPGGRVGLRAVPRPSHCLPARLPRRLRVPNAPPLRAASSSRASSSVGCSRWKSRRARRCCVW